MFEISWSELLILAIVTLVFVGPKDLPIFLRTIGKYAGVIRRQAAEIRTQFDTAMREAEFEAMKKEFEGVQSSVNAEVMGAKAAMDEAAKASEVIAEQRPNPLVPGSMLPPLSTQPAPQPVPHVEPAPVVPTPVAHSVPGTTAPIPSSPAVIPSPAKAET